MPDGAAWLFAFDQIPVPGFLLDVDSTIVSINAAASRLLGKSAAQVVGRPATEVMPRGDNDLSALLDTSRRNGESTYGLHIQTATGTRTLECVMAMIEHDHRPILQLFGIDVTLRKQAEEAARARADAEKLSSSKQRLESLGIVAGGIAHDFNNLLVGVLAEASAAREEAALPPTTREALRRIEAAARRMAQLTRQLLAYSGRGRLETVKLDPDALLNDLRDELVGIVTPRAKLSLTTGAGAAVVEADPSLLRQIVVNLAVNASDANSRVVEISTKRVLRGNVPWWLLEVSDDGGGIDPAVLGRIFEPFFSTKRDRHGLGLSAVHGVVQRLGGDIEVDSRPNQGARFRVWLPILPGTLPKPAVAAGIAPAAKLAGLRVLIADDEPSVRATVRRLLERRGATVTVAADGLEAEARLRQDTFDLILLDVSMPGRSGFEVLEFSRVIRPAVPVILMSGYAERTRGEGGEEEPDAFLEKPFTSSVLDDAIEHALKRTS